jgi:ribosomal protein RSM22 (predicted rRNA methylase)
MDSNLPAALRTGLARMTRGTSMRAMAESAAALSQAYRSGLGSADAIDSADAALAYALARMPATYAAVSAVLQELATAMPQLAPATVLDVGAGPGTAAWAVVDRYPGLQRIRMVDANRYVATLAAGLLVDSEHAALRHANYAVGDLQRVVAEGAAADLTIASYLAGEVDDHALAEIAELLWSRTSRVMVVVEPGTPPGFARIRGLRSQLIGRGAHVVAPCPHDLSCPLRGDDWCHFSRRLNRTRDHRRAKQAALAFEDEKFSYVVLARQAARGTQARVLARPRVSKADVSLKLCTPDGVVIESTPRRDKERYRAAKNRRWGDLVPRQPAPARD